MQCDKWLTRSMIDSWSGAQWVRKNGLNRGHTSEGADDLCTVAGNVVSASNHFVVIAQVVTMDSNSVTPLEDVAGKNDFLDFWLNPTRCISEVDNSRVEWCDGCQIFVISATCLVLPSEM